MPRWPFQSDDPTVDYVARVVTTPLAGTLRHRGKLFVRLNNPVDPGIAESIMDRVAGAFSALLRDLPDPRLAAGQEPLIVEKLLRRLPLRDIDARSVELSASHFTGESSAPGAPSSGPPRRRPSSTPPPPIPQGSVGLPSGTARRTPAPPPPASPSVSARAGAFSQILIIPKGATLDDIARLVAPVLVDTSVRLLVGSLRTYDLLYLRNLPTEDSSVEFLPSFIRPSVSPPGAYEAERAEELERWHAKLGQDRMDALRRECVAFTVASFIRSDNLPPGLGPRLLDGIQKQLNLPIERMVAGYLESAAPTLSQIGFAMATVLGVAPSKTFSSSLAPFATAAEDDATLVAAIVGAAVGTTTV